MKKFTQLSADEQARAIGLQRDQLAVDPALASDPSVGPVLDRLARQRARDAFYLDPDDRVVTLPPTPPQPPTTVP
jgi:hypothetical protein